MSRAQNANRGATRLPLRRRATDPMRDFDRLPRPLRHWLAQAHLPWSPASCRAIWHRVMAEGGDEEAALRRLGDVERAMLARDRQMQP